MNYIRECWYNINDDTNESCCVKYYSVINMVQLLPIEMLTLCEIASYFDPILVFGESLIDFVGISSNENLDPNLILNHIDMPWEWYRLAMNPAISVDFIYNHQDIINIEDLYHWMSSNITLNINHILLNATKSWHWYFISLNESITMNDVKNNLHLPWNYRQLSSNPNLTIKFVKKTINKQWNWNAISCNKAITMDDVRYNQHLPWSYISLSKNPNLTIEFVTENLRNKKGSKMIPWDWNLITYNEAITMDDILNNPRLPWCYEWLPLNPNLTLDFVVNHLDNNWNWNWTNISCHEEISMDDFRKYLYPPRNLVLPLDYESLSENPNLTIDFVLENLSKPWDYSFVTSNKSITIEDICQNPQLNWRFKKMSHNKNINMEYILKHMEETDKYNESFDFDAICRNPSFFVY